MNERVGTSHWGAFRARVEDGRLVATRPFEADPNPPGIAAMIPAAVHHRVRVARPAVRRGWLDGDGGAGRGLDDYVDISWNEGLDRVAGELDRVRRTHGNEAIFGGSYGWASAGRFHHALSQVHRFLNCIGGYTASLGSYSTAAAQAITPHVFGMHFLKLTWGNLNSWETIAEHTETLVMFGGISAKNSQVGLGGATRHETVDWLRRFADDGMRLVTVGPYRADTPVASDWLPARPGSDTALMLALAHVLESEGLVDRDFLARCTVGYERFRPYLLGESDGQPKTPEWAAALSEIDAGTIRQLARRMATTRTILTVSWSLQRAENGEQPIWMAAVLAAMLGQIGLPGGGIGYGYGAAGGIGNAMKRLRGLALPQGENQVRTAIPVARIADMLFDPGGAYQFNGQDRTYPDIRLIYWAGGNPFHHHQDLNRLKRAWRVPETIVVHEPWWTTTARHADIVLPATTSCEREDIGRANGDPFLFHMAPLIAPVGEARDDYAIFTGLADRHGVGETFTEGRDVEDWLRHLYDRFRQGAAGEGVEVPDFETLKVEGAIELPISGPDHAVVPFTAFRADPDAAPLGTPSGRIEIFSEAVAGFGYEDCPGHPVWRAPVEWLGGAAATTYPLHLVSPQPADKLHSQLECALADVPEARPVRMVMHPGDATARGLTSGDIVRVFNDRGACRARLETSEDIRPGVVAMPTGAWHDTDEDGTDLNGNPNVLTRDVGTSPIGQGPSAHSTLVEVAALEDTSP